MVGKLIHTCLESCLLGRNEILRPHITLKVGGWGCSSGGRVVVLFAVGPGFSQNKYKLLNEFYLSFI